MEPSMKKIAIAGNTMTPAYLVLRSMGFTLRVERRKGADADEEWWIAEKEGTELIGEDPVQVLGLASIYAQRGEGWKAADEEIDHFMADIYRMHDLADEN